MEKEKTISPFDTQKGRGTEKYYPLPLAQHTSKFSTSVFSWGITSCPNRCIHLHAAWAQSSRKAWARYFLPLQQPKEVLFDIEVSKKNPLSFRGIPTIPPLHLNASSWLPQYKHHLLLATLPGHIICATFLPFLNFNQVFTIVYLLICRITQVKYKLYFQ